MTISGISLRSALFGFNSPLKIYLWVLPRSSDIDNFLAPPIKIREEANYLKIIKLMSFDFLFFR
jgi:hypothetical protein